MRTSLPREAKMLALTVSGPNPSNVPNVARGSDASTLSR